MKMKTKSLVVFCCSVLSTFLLSCGEGEEEKKRQPSESAMTIDIPKSIQYTIIKEYPHDATAFTEGLEYVDNNIYESTGHYGRSDIRKVDLETGDILKQTDLDKKYFGEGMTVLGDKVYQLTYQERTGFVYDKENLELLKTFSFNSEEGWGMTNDGTNLIYGDGKTSLVFLDPATLAEVKRLTVTDQYGPVANVNELEYINGYIYANQWNTDLILKIDPANGKVVGRADLADLRRRTGIPQPKAFDENAPEVLNGIAYDKTNNRIFITGKNWPKMFEIKLDN